MCVRVRTMRDVKGQKTKIRNVINGDDHQRRLTTPISMSMWMIDQEKPDKISSLKFEGSSQIFSLN